MLTEFKLLKVPGCPISIHSKGQFYFLNRYLAWGDCEHDLIDISMYSNNLILSLIVFWNWAAVPYLFWRFYCLRSCVNTKWWYGIFVFLRVRNPKEYYDCLLGLLLKSENAMEWLWLLFCFLVDQNEAEDKKNKIYQRNFV